MTRHVDAETLARYRDGDLHGWRAWRIRAHLARCPECRQVNSDLAQVAVLLASVPAPPMPDYLSARIQGVLAHEAALQATSAPAHSATASERASASSVISAAAQPTGTDGRDGRDGRDRGRNRRQRAPRWSGLSSWGRLRVAAAAAALVAVVAGGYEIAVHAGGSSSGPSAGSAPRAAAPAAGTGGVSYGPALHYGNSGQDSVRPMTTNIDFTASQLSSQVSGLPGYQQSQAAGPSHAVSPGVSGSNAASGSNGAMFQNIPVSSITGCLNRVAAGGSVVLVDVDRFQGTPALVIVTELSQTSPRQVWVVSTGCSASRSDILDHAVLAAPGS